MEHDGNMVPIVYGAFGTVLKELEKNWKNWKSKEEVRWYRDWQE